MLLNRRLFVQQASMLAASAALLPPSLATAATVTRPGLQLYSLRDAMEQDPIATLKSVSQMGYKEIESYPGTKGFLWGMKPSEFSSLMGALGLDPVSVHTGVENNMPILMDRAAQAGFKKFVVSWIREEERTSLDGYRRMADAFNRYGMMAQQRGLQFGYHNHGYPFTDMEGKLPFDILVTRTSPEVVTFELDVFWVVEPGKDPVAIFNKYPGRFSMAHIKDRDPKNGKLSTVIGQGNLPLPKIMTAAAKAGVKHFFVEVEEYGALTPIASVEQSLTGMKKLTF
jgi:sugar phosphate isomerase/epimerase